MPGKIGKPPVSSLPGFTILQRIKNSWLVKPKEVRVTCDLLVKVRSEPVGITPFEFEAVASVVYERQAWSVLCAYIALLAEAIVCGPHKAIFSDPPILQYDHLEQQQEPPGTITWLKEFRNIYCHPGQGRLRERKLGLLERAGGLVSETERQTDPDLALAYASVRALDVARTIVHEKYREPVE